MSNSYHENVAPARPTLPEKAAKIARDIENGDVLGASKTIRLISEVFRVQVAEREERSGTGLADEIRETAAYFIHTRGSLSPAVGNAVRLMLRELDRVAQGDDSDAVARHLDEATRAYDQKSLDDVRIIACYGANLLSDGDRVMAYDYSSTVTAVLRQAAATGKKLTIVIPESRSLNGGMPILREVVEQGHRALWTVDAAMGHEVQTCSAVFVGVESLSANGGFWTTVGTRSLAILADYYHVPFYVPTELIKIEPRSFKGVGREVKRDPLRIFEGMEIVHDSELVTVAADELEFTPPGLITSYVTEEGVLPPQAIWTVAKKYLSSVVEG